MRYEITWHQLVEWQQYYALDPFGSERADLRSAMAGATIANEIRAIASGLAGKRLDAIQVRDLMIDTSGLQAHESENDNRRRLSGSRSRSRTAKGTGNDNDLAAAENYYKLWAKSIRAKVKESQTPPRRRR